MKKQKSTRTEPTHTEYSLEEIARILGISRERVRQIERSALKKLRHPKVGKKLAEYRRQ